MLWYFESFVCFADFFNDVSDNPYKCYVASNYLQNSVLFSEFYMYFSVSQLVFMMVF